MILHLRQMDHGNMSLEGHESAAPLGLEACGIGVAGDLKYRLEAGLSGGGLWVAGSLQLPVTLECAKCLEPLPWTIKIPEFALQVELEETGGRESIDLTPWLREDILLALPLYPKCDLVAGKTCLARFQSTEFAPAGETPQEQNPAWSALDALKNELKTEN
jgi:uncharacterized protein